MKFKSLLAVLILSSIPFSNGFASGFMQVANVVKIQGRALIDKEAIKVGAEVMEGMEIVIPGAKGFVDIKFQNGHLVRFIAAKINVEKLNPKNTLFKIISGKMYAVTNPMTQDETFEVKDERGFFSLRGTKFMIEVSKKQTTLLVNEGIISVKTKRTETEVRKDEILKLTNSDRPFKVKAAPKSILERSNLIFKDMAIL